LDRKIGSENWIERWIRWAAGQPASKSTWAIQPATQHGWPAWHLVRRLFDQLATSVLGWPAGWPGGWLVSLLWLTGGWQLAD